MRTRFILCCRKLTEIGQTCPSCGGVVFRRARSARSATVQVFDTSNFTNVNPNSAKRVPGEKFSVGLNERVPDGMGRGYIDRRNYEKYGDAPLWDSDPRKLSGEKIRL